MQSHIVRSPSGTRQKSLYMHAKSVITSLVIKIKTKRITQRHQKARVSNVPSNFLKSMCAKVFTSTYPFLECHTCMKKHFLKGKFSCVLSSHDLCVRAHMHSLEGTSPASHFRSTDDV